ncbi:Lysophosphatidylcholine acyltransferase 2 [Tritrichomonas musculus]|uniref:Lysophosphatidylcholine acyltransferase 2 n=1 Tax=Tritrichomonas musculus TaxID=1915356 RepID=A0ABR2ILT9_9EUKA
MPLYTQVPINDPKLHNQTELTEISRKEYDELLLNHPSSKFEDILRIILFFVTLGPIKFILTITFFTLYCIIMFTLNSFKRFFKSERQYKTFAQNVLYPFSRITLFAMGVVYIKRTGKVEKNTRTLLINHLTLFDITAAITFFDSSYLAMKSIKNNFIIKGANEIFNMIYVDRSKAGQGTTDVLRKVQNDYSLAPIVIFPEGKVTNGDGLLGFRTGAFINDTPLQPVTYRYKLWFCSRGLSTIAWVHPNDLFYVWQVFTIPFMTLEIDCLPQICFEGSNKTPQEKAKEVELIMANHLGCLAVKQTNKEYFSTHTD